MRMVAVLLAIGFVLGGALPTPAQDVRIDRTPFERELGIIPPTTEPPRSRPEDADYHSGSGSVILDPGFFERLSVKTETGRFGLAGWTSPNSPAGPDYNEVNGWFTFGLAVTWSSPPLPGKRPANR
jgi:hypothetical protein